MFYICSKAAKRGYATCPTPTLSANIVDNQVIEYLKQIPTIKNALSGGWKDLSVNQKQEILKSVVKEVNYDNSTKTLTIITIEGNQSLTFNVDIKKVKPEKPEVVIKKEPQLRQNLVLAHQIQTILDNDHATSIKQIAGWLNLTPARINQFMNMLLLAPAIQEQILLEDDQKIAAIPEYKVNGISREMIWQEQLKLWQKIL